MKRERRWRLFGLTMTSPHPFVNRLIPGSDDPDLWCRPVDASPIGPAWTSIAPAYRSPIRIDEHQHFLDVVVAADATVFHFSEVVDFYLLDDGIAFHTLDPAYAYMVELHLLGFVMAYWLERAGWPALHASSVVIDGRAVAFASDHGGGKTSLAAEALRAGHPLLSDDVLAITPNGDAFVGRPGYPQMRMWPEQARHFVGHDDLELVHPAMTKLRVPVGGPAGLGSFDGALRPLAAIYLPERSDAVRGVEIEAVPAGAAIFELVRRSFLVGVVEGVGLSARRFRTFARLLETVPVRRLRYPNGLDLLPEVVAAVAADVVGAAAAGRRQ